MVPCLRPSSAASYGGHSQPIGCTPALSGTQAQQQQWRRPQVQSRRLRPSYGTHRCLLDPGCSPWACLLLTTSSQHHHSASLSTWQLHVLTKPGLHTQVKEYMAASLGDQQFAAMQAALAVPPLHTCVRVNMLRATPQVCVGAVQPFSDLYTPLLWR